MPGVPTIPKSFNKKSNHCQQEYFSGISNQISNQTNTILGAMNENVINDLRDKLAVTRDELSNTRQTAQITENILSNLATTNPKPPCYYNCGCGTSLY